MFQVPDMAFMLPYNRERYNIEKKGKIAVGVNVSGLLWKGGFDKNNQFNLNFDYKEYIYQLIEWILSQEDYVIHFIPHVIDLNEYSYDDDYKVINELKDKYTDTVLAPPFETPIEAKSYISKMDCFIGARMHSTIAAFSSGVATIPFSYSRKFEGLFNTLGYYYVIHGNSDSLQEAIDKTKEYIHDYKELKSSCAKSLICVEHGVIEFKKEIERMFEG